MYKFIYVFEEKDKELLVSCGYRLLQDTYSNGKKVYVFENRADDDFCLKNFDKRGMISSNTLTF